MCTVDIEYVEYTDGTIAPASSINANPPPARTANSPVQRTPGRIADYDPLSEARPSPYSARQAATTVIYTSDKGPGAFTFATVIAARVFAIYHIPRMSIYTIMHSIMHYYNRIIISKLITEQNYVQAIYSKSISIILIYLMLVSYTIEHFD